MMRSSSVRRVMPIVHRRSWPALILALMLVSGHCAGLQMLAWTGMLAARVQTRTVGDAVRSTFDGSEPCRLCRMVAALEAADQGTAPDRDAAPAKPVKPGQQDVVPELMTGTCWSFAPIAVPCRARHDLSAWAVPASVVIGVDPPPPRI